MKKIKLRIDDLKIDSFEIGPQVKLNKGTIKGNTDTLDADTCFGPSCRACPTENPNPTFCRTCEELCP